MSNDSKRAEKRMYKFAVSIAFGFLGFCINFYPLHFYIPPHKASLVLGLVFPMLISLSWGWKYGLISLTLGMGGQTMWFLWVPINGWAPFVAIPVYNLWVLWHGWCAKKENKIIANYYWAEIPFRIFNIIIMYTIFRWVWQFNPSPWAPKVALTTAPIAFVNFIVIKQFIEALIILLAAHVLLNFQVFQKILLIKRTSRVKTGYIISAFLLFGLVFWFIAGFSDYLYSANKLEFLLTHQDPSLAESLALQVPGYELFTRTLFILTCLIAGLVVSKYVSKFKESEVAREEAYEIVNKSNSVAFLWKNTEGWPVEFVSKNVEKLFGYSAKDFVSGNISYLATIHPEDQEKLIAEVALFSDKKDAQDFEHEPYRIITKSNEVKWVSDSTNIRRDDQGEITHYQGIVEDITDRKQAEEELRFTQFVMDRSSDIAFWITPDAKFDYVNESASRKLGYSRQELLNMSVADVDPDFPQKVWERFWRELKQQKSLKFETRHQRKDGTIFPVEVVANYVEFGGKAYCCAFVRDITERKQAEAALAAEKEQLTVTLRSIGDGVITSDTAGNIVLMNKVAEELTGWSQEEALNKPVMEVFHIINEKTRKRCENPVEKVLSTGTIISLSNHTVLIAKDNTERSIADSGAPIRDKESRMIGVVLVFRDVTETRKMEEELLKVKKLESVGVLAGGIAHDFNNILAAILGNINLALLDDNLGIDTKKLLSEAEKASIRAKDLTQQLLTFSKGGEPVKETSAIPEIIRDSAEFVLHGSNIICQYHIPDDIWLVDVDKGQVSQVIQNLIINAKHAMPTGGTIKITCENIHSNADEKITLSHQENHIKITITDSGIGIPVNILDKIFDPYFSTKQEGSGLGLAISHSIISKHNGHISAQSTPGVGTTFTVFLPASMQKQKQEKEKSKKTIESSAVKAKIMVMDDEEMVRNIAQAMITRLGHEVVLAHDGTEALELYKKQRDSGEPIDIIITDLTIPGGMGGRDLVKEVLAIDPDAKVIVSSGYSTDPAMANCHEYGFVAAVAKPYQLQELTKVINQILSE